VHLLEQAGDVRAALRFGVVLRVLVPRRGGALHGLAHLGEPDRLGVVVLDLHVVQLLVALDVEAAVPFDAGRGHRLPVTPVVGCGGPQAMATPVPAEVLLEPGLDRPDPSRVTLCHKLHKVPAAAWIGPAVAVGGGLQDGCAPESETADDPGPAQPVHYMVKEA